MVMSNSNFLLSTWTDVQVINVHPKLQAGQLIGSPVVPLIQLLWTLDPSFSIHKNYHQPLVMNMEVMVPGVEVFCTQKMQVGLGMVKAPVVSF